MKKAQAQTTTKAKTQKAVSSNTKNATTTTTTGKGKGGKADFGKLKDAKHSSVRAFFVNAKTLTDADFAAKETKRHALASLRMKFAGKVVGEGAEKHYVCDVPAQQTLYNEQAAKIENVAKEAAKKHAKARAEMYEAAYTFVGPERAVMISLYDSFCAAFEKGTEAARARYRLHAKLCFSSLLMLDLSDKAADFITGAAMFGVGVKSAGDKAAYYDAVFAKTQSKAGFYRLLTDNLTRLLVERGVLSFDKRIDVEAEAAKAAKEAAKAAKKEADAKKEEETVTDIVARAGLTVSNYEKGLSAEAEAEAA